MRSRKWQLPSANPSTSLFARLFSSALPETLGPSTSTSTSTPLLSDVAAILSRRSWHRSLALRRLAPSLTPSHVSHLLRTLPFSPSKALTFFDWMAQRPGFSHSPQSYASLLALLLDSPSPPPVGHLIISMIRSSTFPDEARSVIDFVSKELHEGKKKDQHLWKGQIRGFSITSMWKTVKIMLLRLSFVLYNIYGHAHESHHHCLFPFMSLEPDSLVKPTMLMSLLTRNRNTT